MRIISWNVNGIRSAIEKGFADFFTNIDADIFCIQETKKNIGQLDLFTEIIFNNYFQYWNAAERKGYSGTAIFSKQKPLNVIYGLNNEQYDNEGRVITLEFRNFYLINCYTPNSKRTLERLPYREKWENQIQKFIKKIDTKKPVIYCGDLNVAHKDIDLANPISNKGRCGVTNLERKKMTELLSLGFTDSFRFLYPNITGKYTWWSYMNTVRQRNIGWRLDYIIVSDRLAPLIQEAMIFSDILGSDHCPIGLDLTI